MYIFCFQSHERVSNVCFQSTYHEIPSLKNCPNCNITQFAFKESPRSKRSIQSVDKEADVTLNEQKENPAFSENNEEVSFERIYITID